MPSRTRAPRSPRTYLVLALLAAMVAVFSAGATLAHQTATSPPRATAAGSGGVEPAISRTSTAVPGRDADPGRAHLFAHLIAVANAVREWCARNLREYKQPTIVRVTGR